MVFIPLSIFMIVYEEMIREKILNLRFGLIVIGCSNTAFWVSWLITGIFFSAAISTLMYICGYLYAFDVFLLCPFYVIFAIFFSICFCYVTMGAALCCLMNNQTTAYTVSYTILLVSVITSMAMSDVLWIYKIFFNIDMPEWVNIFRFAFYLLPSFHFVKLYGDIVRICNSHMLFD